MALIAFSQSTIVVTKFIESCQLFSYLSYLNLQYPLNTKTYFKMLNYFNVDPIFDSSYTIDNSENNSSNSSESNLSLNSSILLSNYTNNNRRILDDQNKFEIIKYRESEFLKNSIVILAINGVVFGFSVVYSIMYFFFNLQKHNILTTLYSILHWSLPIRIFNLTSLQLFFYIALEFSKKSDMNNFDGVISIMITVLLVLLHLYFLKIINRDYNNAETYKYYGALFDGLSTFFFIKRNYFFINIVRKALVVTFIVSTTLDSQSQILGCMIVCLMFLSYIVFFKPFLSNLEWIFNIIMELCFCSLLSVIFTYSYIDYDNAPEKIRFGYAIIVSLSVFMLSTFIFAIIQIWKFLKNLYIVFKNREKNIGLLEKKSSSDSLNDSSNSAFKSKIGDAFYEYKREYDNQKKVIVVYSQEMEEKKKRREEERVEREEMKIRIKDIEDEKKSRTGLQSIFTRQKNKVNKKKNSFDEEEEDEEKNPEVQTNLDVVREQEVIKNRKIEDENLKGFEKFFKKQKKTKEKNSVDEREQDEQNDEKKEINIEMKNY